MACLAKASQHVAHAVARGQVDPQRHLVLGEDFLTGDFEHLQTQIDDLDACSSRLKRQNACRPGFQHPVAPCRRRTARRRGTAAPARGTRLPHRHRRSPCRADARARAAAPPAAATREIARRCRSRRRARRCSPSSTGGGCPAPAPRPAHRSRSAGRPRSGRARPRGTRAPRQLRLRLQQGSRRGGARTAASPEREHLDRRDAAADRRNGAHPARRMLDEVAAYEQQRALVLLHVKLAKHLLSPWMPVSFFTKKKTGWRGMRRTGRDIAGGPAPPEASMGLASSPNEEDRPPGVTTDSIRSQAGRGAHRRRAPPSRAARSARSAALPAGRKCELNRLADARSRLHLRAARVARRCAPQDCCAVRARPARVLQTTLGKGFLRESNPRLIGYQPIALPTELRSGGEHGSRTHDLGSQDPRSTAELGHPASTASRAAAYARPILRAGAPGRAHEPAPLQFR